MAAGQHLPGRPATAVAEPEGHQRHRAVAVVGVVAFGVRELAGYQLRVVGVDRREVGEDPGAVDPLPPEGVVRHAIGLVPGDLLGEEVLGPGSRRRSAAGRPSTRRSPAATPRGSRRRTRPGRIACRPRTAGPWPRRPACSCPTPPTCRRPGRIVPPRPWPGSARRAPGGACLIQANCCAEEQAKTNSGSLVHQVDDGGRMSWRTCGSSRGPATARPSRCARDRPRAGGARWRPPARPARRPVRPGPPLRCRRRHRGPSRPAFVPAPAGSPPGGADRSAGSAPVPRESRCP